MKPSKTISLLLLSAVFLAAASCSVQSTHPLSEEKKSQLDERLIGRWRIAGEEPAVIIAISKSGENRLEATIIAPSSADSEKDERYSFFTTTVASRTYMNVPNPEAQTPDWYFILQYSLPDPDTLTVRELDTDTVAAAIAANELHGKVKKRTNCVFAYGIIPVPYRATTVLIEDSPEALAKFVEKHGDDCCDASALLTLKKDK